MLIRQISIFVENKPGRLASITQIIADAKIDIRAMCIADTTDFGILRLIVNKPEEAEKLLRDAGLTVSITRVLAIGVNDEPGGLAGALNLLSEKGIAVEYIYAFIARDPKTAFVVLRLDDNDRAAEVLREGGYRIITCHDVMEM